MATAAPIANDPEPPPWPGRRRMVEAPDGMPARVVKAHNVHKATVIGRYADIVAKAMQHKWENLCYVDLFCGPGVCWVEGSGDFVYGSPLLALDVEPAYTHFIFNDKDPLCREALEQRISGSGASPRFLSEDVNKPATVQTVRGAIPTYTLTLALLDPQGCNLGLETIARLVEGRRPIDMLINLPINSLKRCAKEHSHKIDYVLGDDWPETCNLDAWPATVRAHFKTKMEALGYPHLAGKQVFGETTNSPLYDFTMVSRDPRAEDLFLKATATTAHQQQPLFA